MQGLTTKFRLTAKILRRKASRNEFPEPHRNRDGVFSIAAM